MKLLSVRLAGNDRVLSLKRDLLHAWRSASTAPLFALAVVLPLALGIGANTAIFSVADALLRQPLPFPQMDQIVLVTEVSPARPDSGAAVAPANYLDWTAEARSFATLAAFSTEESTLTSSGTPEAVASAAVTDDFFPTLGVTPLRGRLLSQGDSTTARQNQIVLSYGFWKQRLAGDPEIIGKELTLDSVKYTIVGILRKGSGFPLTTDVWRPLVLTGQESQDRATHRLQIIARFRPGVAVAQAGAEMREIAQRLAQAYPDTNQGWGARVFPLSDLVSNGLTAQYTRALMGAVLFVLLIVCANLTNLQLARGIARKREWAVRYALGATRAHVVRLQLVESVAFALVSAVLAVCFAEISLHLIHINMPATVARFIPGFDEINLNYRAMFFTLGIAVISGIASGLAPAIFSSRADVNQELNEGGKGFTRGASHRRMSTLLLTIEVALALMLLVGTGLMVRGSSTLRQEFAGMQPAQVLTARLHLTGPQYAAPQDSLRLYRRLLEDLARNPGIQAAAAATTVPYGSYGRSTAVTVQEAPQEKSAPDTAISQIVTPDFFQTLRIPVVAGRPFQPADNEDSSPVVIVSQQFAHHYWPGKDPIGRQLRVGNLTQSPWLRVIGVAGDVRYEWLDRGAEFVVYRPAAQAQQRGAYIVVRTQGDPELFASFLRERMAAIDHDQPVSAIQSWDEVISQSMLGLSYMRVMMSVLAVLAILVASLGLYGLMSYSVATRIYEMGVRMALGARRRQVISLVIMKGMLIIAIGLAVGLAGSLLLSRTLASLVFGVNAFDPWTFAGAAVLFLAVGFIACYQPARQASRVDPLVVLRAQ